MGFTNMSDAQELVAVAYDITGKPSYNGYETVHEALWNLEHEFQVLEFADRMLLSIDILNDLEPPISEGRSFMYTFEYDYGDLRCSVYDVYNIEDPIFEAWGRDLLEKGIMKDNYDLIGLFNYLVKTGELLPEDKLTLMHS